MSAGPRDPTDDDPTDGDPRDLGAAEYVLGTLPRNERAAFERTLTADAAARAAVRAWERRLAPLGLASSEATPPQGLWDRIARALPGAAANDDRLGALQRQVRRWRVAAGGAGLIAAGLAGFVAFGLRPGGAPSQRYVAIVSSGGELPALIVSVDTRAGTAQVRPVKAEAPSGRSLELWYVGTDKSPKPLGVLTLGVPDDRANRVTLPEGARRGEGVFAVSVEPPGGSPSGQPTGPVIYTGPLIRD